MKSIVKCSSQSIQKPTQPKYTQVQCIGFNIGTRIVNRQYAGLSDDSKDWKARVILMNEAIEHAYEQRNIQHSPDCLKIFMAPEFFFRGKRGGYELDTCLQITETLRKLVQHSALQDWLFVFGSTVGHSINVSPYLSKYEVYNYSVIQKGNGSEEDCYIVMKEHRANTDFVQRFRREPVLPHNILQIKNTKHLTPTEMVAIRNEQKQYNYDSNSVFEIDGLRVGVEICLDHLMDRINPFHQNPILDVHLVPSCGSGNIYPYHNLKKHGISFVCDGVSGIHSNVQQKNRISLQREESTFTSKLSPIIKCLFSTSTPIIHTYTPHRIVEKEKGLDRAY